MVYQKCSQVSDGFDTKSKLISLYVSIISNIRQSYGSRFQQCNNRSNFTVQNKDNYINIICISLNIKCLNRAFEIEWRWVSEGDCVGCLKVIALGV